MELKDAIMARRSIRAFKTEPVPKELLEEIFETAKWAPSWGNTQAWSFVVVQGRELKLLKERFTERFLSEAPASPEVEMPEKWDGARLKRYQALGRDLLSALSIPREDKEARQRHYLRMHQLFDAPCIIYGLLDKGFNPYLMLDLGLMFQNIALLAVEKGLGTCFLARSVVYPDIIREVIPAIPESQQIIMGLAIGYPEDGHPANGFRRSRAEIEEFTTWVISG